MLGGRQMTFCDQCGSGSCDKDGFCGGCGAPWPLQPSVAKVDMTGRGIVSAVENSSRNIGVEGLLFDVKPKRVWVAVLLALGLGPIGLLYCTTTGAIVMLIVSIVLALFLGNLATLIVLPVCAYWAWKAARESESMFE